jgi:hypothetical protein
VRLRLRKKRFLEEENKMGKNKPSSEVYDELAKKIAKDARDHRLRKEKDQE